MGTKVGMTNIKKGDDNSIIIYQYPSKRRWMNAGAFSVLKMLMEQELQKQYPNQHNAQPNWVYVPVEKEQRKVRTTKKPVAPEKGEFLVATGFEELRGFIDDIFLKKHPQYRAYFFPGELKPETSPVKAND